MTEEKTFEEKFPSLLEEDEDGDYINLGEDDCGGIAATNPIEYVLKEAVEKHCLDKQRVREAIIKTCERTETKLIAKMILKELGLNDNNEDG
jgi:hypothetical protein